MTRNKNIQKLKVNMNIFLYFITILASCSNAEKTGNQPGNFDNKINLVDTIEKNIQDTLVTGLSNFEVFIKEMAKDQLPNKITLDDTDILFARKNKVSREVAFRFLANNDSSMILQPTGGFYEFYDVKLVEDLSSDEIIFLMYKRYSYDCYSGFMLASYKKSGNLIDNLFIAGDSIEYGQIEFYKLKDFEIRITERIIYQDKQLDIDNFEGNKTTRDYIIDNNGNLIETFVQKEKICLNFPKGEKVYRFEECSQIILD